MGLTRLFRSDPDQHLTRRVVPAGTDKLRQRRFDLGPRLSLFARAESHHELAQRQWPPRELHGIAKGRKAAAGRHGVDRHIAEAGRGEGLLEQAWGAEPELPELV